MQGRDQGNVPEEVSFINTQLSGRYGSSFLRVCACIPFRSAVALSSMACDASPIITPILFEKKDINSFLSCMFILVNAGHGYILRSSQESP